MVRQLLDRIQMGWYCAAPDDGGSGDGGGGSWTDALPEDLRGNETLMQFKPGEGEELIPMPAAVAQSYVNARSLIGRDKIPMPRTPEEFMEAYNRLGRPETVDGYELAAPEELHPMAAEDLKNIEDFFRKTAHEIGLSKDQGSKLFTAYANRVNETIQGGIASVEEQMTKAENELRTTWGEAYNTKMVLANRAIAEVGGQEVIDLLNAAGLGRNPYIVKMFAKIGEGMAESLGFDKGGNAPVNAAALDDQISEAMADPSYMDEKAPNHKAAVMKVNKLMQQKFGNTPVTGPGAPSQQQF